jgi:hypothetical protein
MQAYCKRRLGGQGSDEQCSERSILGRVIAGWSNHLRVSSAAALLAPQPMASEET